MDIASVLVGLVICVVTAVILYLISVKSFQEKPFEEVLAEQQQFADSLLKGEKSNKDKEKKSKKQVVKKNKEKEKGKSHGSAAPTPQAVAFEEKLHVEFEPDAEVIPEEPLAIHVEKEKKKSEKKDKVKPILRNRDQVSTETFDPDVDSLNHFMEHPPKDDVELKARDKDKTSKKGPKPVVEEKIVASEALAVEPVAVKEVAFTVGRGGSNSNAGNSSAPVAQPPQQPSTPKKQRKKNAKTDSLDTPDVGEELLLQLGGTEKLLSAIRQLPLTSSELQTMIEVLLNRQQEASGTVESEWMERGGRLDPIGALRKQLAEKEKALQEELEEKQVYQNKLRTLGTEMTTERNRAAAARNQLEEALARQTAEIQILNARIQQSSEQHATELNTLRVAVQQAQKVSQTSDEHLRQLQRLQDENNQYEARFASAQQMQQEMAARIQQLEDFLVHKENQALEQANQLAILGPKLQESEQIRTQFVEIQHEVARLNEALQASENQSLHAAHDAHVRLEEMERTKQLLEDRITKVDRDLAMERSLAAQNEERIRQEVSRLCLENQALNLQLSNTSQTRQDDDAKFAALQEQLQIERNQAMTKQAETQHELDRLRNEAQTLSQQLASALESQKSHQSQFEVTMKDKDEELEVQKKKNNELRDKNYKAMDALAAAEKALVELKKASSIAASNAPNPADINRAIGAGLQRVFPELTFDASTTPAVFADSLARQVSQSLDRLQREEQSKAQAQVMHYKTVLSQTEELLNRLQSRVEFEEASWKVKMIQNESDLMTVRQEKDFWMDLCHKQEAQVAQQQQQQQEQQIDVAVDVASLHSRIESLEKDKERLLQEVEKERQVAIELQSETGSQREKLLTTESQLADERRAVQHLRDQLDQAKAELSATKVGSIGFMVGWAKSSAATVAAATARKNSLNSESLSSGASPPSPQQDGVATKCIPAATNGNGTKEESPIEEHLSSTALPDQRVGDSGSRDRSREHDVGCFSFRKLKSRTYTSTALPGKRILDE